MVASVFFRKLALGFPTPKTQGVNLKGTGLVQALKLNSPCV